MYFCRITSVKAWEDYFIKEELKSTFRKSLKSTSDPYAISAWLRQGEIMASESKTENIYSHSLLKKSLPQFLQLVEEQPSDFSQRLQTLCSATGVKLIYIPHITHAPVNGCTRWIGDTPCIQLTDKQKRNDVFWFSLFHEIGHIQLHGKKDVFLDSSTNSEKEQEADRFASDTLLSKSAEQEIINELANKQPTRQFITEKARQYKTHPAIIIGRLQHCKILPQNSIFNDMIVSVNLFKA